MAQVPCHRCGGDGKLPQFNWNKGGICFTCGGDGKVNTFSTIKLNKMTMKSEMRDYLKHSSNRDIASIFITGENFKLKDTQHIEMRAELKQRANDFYGIDTSKVPDAKELAKTVLAELDKREKAMPESYKKSPYFQAGKVSLVPVHWLQKFQGNSLRRDKSEMREFANQLLEEGLKDPVMMIIGQQDRRVSIGEGNHRTFAHLYAGLDYVPVRVSRQQKNEGGMTVYYDKMSAVPKDDYFKADASPEEVFDTFYDHSDIPEEPKPSVLENTQKVPAQYLESWYPTIDPEEVGVDISETDLTELGIKHLHVKGGRGNIQEETEYFKGVVEQFYRVYGKTSDFMDFAIREDLLTDVIEETDKRGSFLMDYERVVGILSILQGYGDGDFAPKKTASEEYDDLMSLLELDDDDIDIDL